MKLIDLIVKEVKREDIPSGVNFITQDCNTSNYQISFWESRPSKSISYWFGGGELYSFRPSQKSHEAKDLVINISDLMAAYDEAGKKAIELVQPDNTQDHVNHPPHYNNGSVECIDVIAEMVRDKKGIEAACVANVVKYLYRYKNKGGIESVKKAQWYLNKMIEEMESGKL